MIQVEEDQYFALCMDRCTGLLFTRYTDDGTVDVCVMMDAHYHSDGWRDRVRRAWWQLWHKKGGDDVILDKDSAYALGFWLTQAGSHTQPITATTTASSGYSLIKEFVPSFPYLPKPVTPKPIKRRKK